MSEQRDPDLQRLLDRQAIADCMVRYTRGVDRMDRDLLLSAYHDDAIDVRRGVTRSAREFVDYLFPTQVDRDSCLHVQTGLYVELDGDVAHAESYYVALIRLKETDRALATEAGHGPLHAGRYVDRLERRDGEWRIAKRVTVSEMRYWVEPDAMPALSELGTRGPSDISYARPL